MLRMCVTYSTNGMAKRHFQIARRHTQTTCYRIIADTCFAILRLISSYLNNDVLHKIIRASFDRNICLIRAESFHLQEYSI